MSATKTPRHPRPGRLLGHPKTVATVLAEASAHLTSRQRYAFFGLVDGLCDAGTNINIRGLHFLIKWVEQTPSRAPSDR